MRERAEARPEPPGMRLNEVGRGGRGWVLPGCVCAEASVDVARNRLLTDAVLTLAQAYM